MTTLEQFLFLEFHADHLDVPGFSEFYARIGHRQIFGDTFRTLDIARIIAKEPGQGHFTNLIHNIRNSYPDLGIYVENVINERFRESLKLMGFVRVTDTRIPSYFLYPQFRSA